MATEENGFFNDYSLISDYYTQKLATADSLLEAAEKRKAQNRIAQRRSRQRLKQASAGNKEKVPECPRSSSSSTTKSRNQESGAIPSSTTPPVEAEVMADEIQQPTENQQPPELYRSPAEQYARNPWSASETQQQIPAMNEVGRDSFHTGNETEPQFDLSQDEMMWSSHSQIPTQPSIHSNPASRGPFKLPQNQRRPRFSPYRPTMPSQENMQYTPSAEFSQGDFNSFGSQPNSNPDYFLFNQDFQQDYAQNLPRDYPRFNNRPSRYNRSEDGDFPRNSYDSWGPGYSEHRNLKGITTLEARLEYVLEAIGAAGFENFDEVIIAYYTEQFEKGSVADITQKTSRSRRLQVLLARLLESSKSWTLWEARGYRDEIMKAAESMYVQELRRFTQRRERFHGGSGSECSHQTSSTDQSGKDISPIGSPIQADVMDQKTRLERMRIYQNTLPNLWTLISDLAGMGSSHSEFVVLSVISILHKSRMHPNMDFSKLPFNMQRMFDAQMDMQGNST